MTLTTALLLACLQTPAHAAIPHPPGDTTAPAPAAPKGRWFLVPYAGGYLRTMIMVVDGGARVGVDLVRDVVGVSAEAGGVVLGVGPGKTFTRGAIRADLHPLPFTIFEGLYVHTERMFFGPGADYTAAWGIGTGYAAYTNAKRNVRAFGELNIITGIGDPIPMIGGGAVVLF